MYCVLLSVKIQEYESGQKVQEQKRLLERAESDAATRFGLERPQRLSREAMDAREKALREMMELEQRTRELEEIESRQISELEAAQKELERTHHTAETARELVQRAKQERDIQQEAQRKVHDASARAADRIQQEREYTRRAEEKRCEVQPTSALVYLHSTASSWRIVVCAHACVADWLDFSARVVACSL